MNLSATFHVSSFYIWSQSIFSSFSNLCFIFLNLIKTTIHCCTSIKNIIVALTPFNHYFYCFFFTFSVLLDSMVFWFIILAMFKHDMMLITAWSLLRCDVGAQWDLQVQRKGARSNPSRLFSWLRGLNSSVQLPIIDKNPVISSRAVAIITFEHPVFTELGRKTCRCIDLGSFPLIDLLSLD